MSTVDGGPRLLGGRYELRERIATGGMGEVWRGRDVVLQRTVAVKVLRSEYADDPTFVARFRAEARNAAALNHPNIACVLDYGEAPEEQAGEHLAYLVMELVEGAPLSARLAADGPMDPHDTLVLLRQTASALAEAHRRGLVHRDVKPANILVRPDGAVKLTDFGIARSTDSVPLTGTGQVVGTAQYMSPEQAKGEPATPASDVYALGLVGYESLTGHAAFEGTNPVTVALQHVVADPQPLPADLPEQVRGLIDSALAKDPQQRIPDGAAFFDAVQETLGEGQDGDPVSDTRPARLVTAAGAARGPATGRPVTATRPPARRRALAVLLPLLALCALAGALLLVLGPGAGDDGEGTASGASVAADQGTVLAADDHVGRPYEDVAAQLEALGLVVVRSEQVTADRPAGTVTGISPTGVRLDDGDEVRVTVAVAPAEEDLPLVPETTGGSVGGASVPVEEEPVAEPPASDGTTDTAPAPDTGAGTTTPDGAPSTSPDPAPPSTSQDPAPPPTDPGTSPAPAPDPGTPTEPTGPTAPPEPTAPTEPAGPTGGTSEPPATDTGSGTGTAPQGSSTGTTAPAPAAAG
ncbi:protein kinase domain-containing protein [Blastococcus sp. SYSU D00813]